MQFSAIVNRFIVKTQLNSAFTNDLKRKFFFFRKMLKVTDYAALKVQLQTKQSPIYSYFSGPVLNNELFFANGKILPTFVNQTIAASIVYCSRSSCPDDLVKISFA